MQDSNVELDDVPELLDLTLDEAGLESPPLLLASVDELDFAELLLDPFDSADAPLRVTLEEEDSSSMLLDDSSSSGAKLLSSSPHATKKNAKASAKM